MAQVKRNENSTTAEENPAAGTPPRESEPAVRS